MVAVKFLILVVATADDGRHLSLVSLLVHLRDPSVSLLLFLGHVAPHAAQDLALLRQSQLRMLSFNIIAYVVNEHQVGRLRPLRHRLLDSFATPALLPGGERHHLR